MHTKIGFDKFPVPSIITEVQLSDIVTGEKLVDQAGLPLVTDAERVISEIATSKHATSVVTDPNTIEPIKVVEQFPETSETATTLLGISRAETQLSLFSDVSVLGFDESSWETYNYGSGAASYGPWESRTAVGFGQHYGAQMIEETGEQAIKLGAFPVPYSYPFGLGWEDLGRYNELLYQQFKNFIDLGNILYEELPGLSQYFLDGSKVFIGSDEEIEFVGVTEAEGFTLIDTWTRTWVDIRSNIFSDPTNPGTIITPSIINGLTGSNPSFDETRPGYSSSTRRLSLMQSRKTYRYQPGRISGFTFGARISSDSGSAANVIEWGIANPTDQYVFQVRGANFSIVRRSTVPLDPDVIRANGLEPSDQRFESSGDPFNLQNYYTLVIPRDNFNGDKLNGNGRSGYLLTTPNVTMYKIEFGWYGAIGAKFYVYIPVDNGEARWVLIHTLVIENKLGQPCLEDPYFRFKYQIDIRENATLRTPQYIYKYGASCYIDGGDEGALTQNSFESGLKDINSTISKPLIGLTSKTTLLNSDGIAKENKKIIFPKTISATASELTRVDVVTCKACPGFGHVYNHGLIGGTIGRTFNITLNTSALNTFSIVPANPLDVQPSELFTVADIGSKIIADGLYGGYIKSLDLETSPGSGLFEEAVIERIATNGFTKVAGGFPSTVFSYTVGDVITVPFGTGTQYPYQVRLTNYDAIAASITPLTGSKIEIQFLNPRVGDSFGHFAEFLLGVTDKVPVEVLDSGGDPDINWKYSDSDTRTSLPLSDILFGEHIPSGTGRTRKGIEAGEALGTNFSVGEIDYRIPAITGILPGVCSTLTVEQIDKIQLNSKLELGNPKTGEPDGNYYIVLEPNESFQSDALISGEVGLYNGTAFVSTGITFTSEQDSYDVEEDTIYYAQISGQLPGKSDGDDIQIALSSLRIFWANVNKSKVMKFNPYPLYLVCFLRDKSAVNSISVKEIIGDMAIASSPQWLLNNNIDKSPLVSSPAEDDFPPVNFVSKNRLSAVAVDVEVGQQLRPYSVVNSFYVGAGETKIIDMSNIYGSDRESITPDLFNREATFVVGKTMAVSSGTIQISINTSEQ
jgi:hypothetical protein